MENVGALTYDSNIVSNKGEAMALTAGEILKIAADLNVRPSIVLDVVRCVVQQVAGADAERVGNLEDRGRRGVALTL